MGEASFAATPGESLGLSLRPVEAEARLEGLRVRRLEFNSGGDRVPARLVLPARGDGPHPLVLLQHGAGGSKSADYMDYAAGPWARAGAAVLSIDFPLHGERASAKLGERVLASLGSREPAGEALWTDFVRRAVADLGRALDAAAEIPELDAERVAYAAFSLGSILGATFLGHDPRPRAAALALGGGGFGPPAVDPARHLGRFAPRPLLFVNASRDETVPRSATEALYAAAGDPKRIEWFDCTHSALPGRALKAMWEFLREPLGLG
jgi:cephalosporin-C deacetylase-like acetyl esterase